MALSANFDLGAHGANIATSDAGDATPWDVVSIGGGGETLTYDQSRSVNGAFSAAFHTTGGGGTAHLQWTTAFGTQTEYYGRACLDRAANPGSSIAHIRHLRTGGTTISWDLEINSTGKIVIKDQGGITLATSTNSIPLSSFFRVEWHINNTTGFIEVLLYNDPYSFTLTETVISASGQSIAADTTFVDFGVQALSQDVSFDAVVDVATSYPGPVLTPTATVFQPHLRW